MQIRAPSARHSFTAILAGATVAGFGLSIGHGLYRDLRKNISTILFLAAICGTAFACWDLARGHRRGWKSKILVYAFDPFVILVSICLTLILCAALARGGAGIIVGLCIQGVMALAGWSLGRRQREGRLGAFAVEAHNTDFLERNGFRDVGGRDQTLVDACGRELRLDDVRSDAILFKLPGRRVVRARIELDAAGRMLSYSHP